MSILRRPIVLLLAAFAVGCGGSQEQASVVVGPSDVNLHATHVDGPRIITSNDSGDVLHHFSVKNESESEIVLKLKSRSCGCVSYDLPTNRIAPGEIGTVSLGIPLTLGDMDRAEKVLVSTGKAEQVIAIELRSHTRVPIYLPSEGENIQLVEPGTTGVFRKRVLMHDMGGTPQVPNVIADSENAKARIEDLEVMGWENDVRTLGAWLVVEYEMPGYPDVATAEQTVLKLQLPEFEVEQTVTWRPELSFSFYPSELFFARGQAETAEKRVRIRGLKDPSLLLRVTSSADCLSAEQALDNTTAGASSDVALKVAVDWALVERSRTDLFIDIDVSGDQKARLPVKLLK